jgi:hypothetical protein
MVNPSEKYGMLHKFSFVKIAIRAIFISNQTSQFWSNDIQLDRII